MSSRRNFLRQVGAAGIVALGGTPPGFLSRAAAEKDGQSNSGRILVLLQLAGGNDGLNTVVPISDPAYYSARPGIAIGKSTALKIDSDLGLHPSMTGLHKLYQDGRLAIVQGVGYPKPNRSHFRSMDIWHSAKPEIEYTKDGWLGRALDATGNRFEGQVPALALGVEKLPLALVAGRFSVPTIKNPSAYQLQLGPGPDSVKKLQRRLLGEFADQPAKSGSELDFLRKTARTAYASAEKLKQVTSDYKAAAEYPGSQLAQRLKLIAQMIAGGLETQIYFVSLGGFDTHAQQQGAHTTLLNEFSSSVAAFFADLKGHKLDDRVLLASYSEFGRRVFENGSLGTDHGAASQLFVVTQEGKGGVLGKHPSLTDLAQGDLKFHTDFRSVYATLLEKWLGMKSRQALGGDYKTIGFV